MYKVLKMYKGPPPEITDLNPTQSCILDVILDCALGDQLTNSTTKACLWLV